jgi:hypothetical protein
MAEKPLLRGLLPADKIYLAIIARRRRAWEERHGEQNDVPPLVQAALDNLRAVAAKRLKSGEEAEACVVEILARAAQDIRSS